MIHPESSRCVYVIHGVWAFLCGDSMWIPGLSKRLNTAFLFFPLMKKVVFLLSGNFCLFNRCSLEMPVNEFFSPFLHMTCCLPQSSQGSGVSLSPHLPWSVIIDMVRVKGESKISTGKSGSPFLPKMGNVLDWRLTVWVTWLSSVSAQHGAVSTLPVLLFSF